ncbi:mitochondrial import inner membrane translocase subunit TIM16 [Microbotryomycetes sp. JL221]|nr:mitochondrial import inner membrane translocase subunit TIM16 [Microbotryomycetes sp. JL221]
MSAPRIIAQVVILGSQILGKAFVEAWRQAARNARASPAAGQSSSSASGATQDAMSRNFNMTLDEAAQILNVKRTELATESELAKMLKNFDHLFEANKPLTAEGKPHSSHYLQSKIVRAKERIEAELPNLRGEGTAPAEGGAAAPGSGSSSGGGPSPGA